MGVDVVLWKSWSRSTVATAPQFSKVISAILQVYMCVFMVLADQRILSFLSGTEIWHKSGWGMGVCCGEQLQTLTVQCYFLQTHRNILPPSPHNHSVHNGRYKHRRCDKPGPKISRDKVKDAVSPKAKRKTSACAASSLPVSVKSSPTVWHSCLLLLNAARRGGAQPCQRGYSQHRHTTWFFSPFFF